MTIWIWDAKTGAAIGKPLEGHTHHVLSVAYSPDGQHILSGSRDSTIRIWDARNGATVGKPLKGHAMAVCSVAYSPNGWYFVSGSWDNTIHVWNSFPHPPIHPFSSCNPTHADCYALPDTEGWVRDSKNGLLYWVTPDCHAGLHSPTLLTIPPVSHTHPFLSILRSLSLEPLGPKYVTVHRPSLLFTGLCTCVPMSSLHVDCCSSPFSHLAHFVRTPTRDRLSEMPDIFGQ